ncbi:DUF3010 family protein [Marinomonas sp. 15G1-11]|uniref:DUF3010 family protein n=1 Tax=Marinomonas phaeophyticola TaxID=3004091 RepID=A0ABT4JQN2_9GAMM|nr:DUF3010 family protein [Marinomonas sp. 15G1-11]MCZ2720698.1 DUF3010 family protein [Marinomonas sp. 15G1-11]
MITCGIEIKSNEAILCLLSKDRGLFQIIDCRQIRIPLVQSENTEAMRKYQFTLRKLFEDYNVNQVAIKERPTKGKFAGSSAGFKIETAIQLIDSVEVKLISGNELKESIKENPFPIPFSDTGLKAFQEGAFSVAYAVSSSV